ncbi:Trp biosynthesis-associated membrane protein [Gulosibacter hominis]|uniref:Trp biosynthesis-associated membrane protein n=1 Tax=Gulosibacter hominis TaxID=2770504 RepID=UPI00191A2DD4|nr:Trp biosynthesis-associated membrane protein [Gulosibacter hominis]
MTTTETNSPQAARGRVYQRASMLLVLAGALAGLVTTLLPWVTAHADGGQQLSASADVANPATLALSLAGLASAAALWLIGRWPRIVLGVLLVLIGIAGVMTVATMADAQVLQRALERQLQLDPAGALNSGADLMPARTFAPWLAMLGGVLLAIGGALTAATAQLWKGGGRRYAVAGGGAASEPAAQTKADVRVDQWDALSAGEDPTLDDEDVSSRENSQ